MTITPYTVLVLAAVTALATGLGALPFVVFRRPTRTWLALSNAIASGLMIAASFALLYEGLEAGLVRVVSGALAGVIFMAAISRVLHDHGELELGQMRGADALKALMIVGVMTLHSLTEGVGVGVSFSGGEKLGVFITTAIAVHNIPEGLAISLVLVPRGTSPWRAGGWSIFSSLPQPIMAVPAYLFVTIFRPFLPVGLGLAAGAMIWMVFAGLIPDSLEEASASLVATVISLSFTAMLVFQALL